MTQRVEGGKTYTQVFDAENRLVSVTVDSQITQFVYDADGKMVKKINPDGSYVLYIGSMMEIEKNSSGTSGTETQVTLYYPGGAVRVITSDTANALYYVLGDQLGSASVVLDASGAITAQTRYYPFGETRVSTGTLPTDKLFTGQRAMEDLGIYYYGARFYSPSLGRFLSADTIVSGIGNSQAYDRYSYVLNNPIIYIDPTGHINKCSWVIEGGGTSANCSSDNSLAPINYLQEPIQHHEAINQFGDLVPSELGDMACGIVSCSLGDPERISEIAQIAQALGVYTSGAGMQPHTGLLPVAEIYWEERRGGSVEEKDNWTIMGLMDALSKGNHILVDIRFKHTDHYTLEGISKDVSEGGSHFAEVLGYNSDEEVIYIDDTLNVGHWEVSFDQFEEIWYKPELMVSPAVLQDERDILGPNFKPDPVSNWAIIIGLPK